MPEKAAKKFEELFNCKHAQRDVYTIKIADPNSHGEVRVDVSSNRLQPEEIKKLATLVAFTCNVTQTTLERTKSPGATGIVIFKPKQS